MSARLVDQDAWEMAELFLYHIHQDTKGDVMCCCQDSSAGLTKHRSPGVDFVMLGIVNCVGAMVMFAQVIKKII